MKIIIDIDEDIAQRIIDGKKDEPMNIVQAYSATIAYAIKEGVSLPKGHGDLIDRQELLKSTLCKTFGLRSVDIENAPTIIEADRSDEPSITPSYNSIKTELKSCEDCISRQAVLDVIEREEFKGDAISEIEKLSSVTPQPKTGHWNRVTQAGHLVWECDKCKWRQRFYTNYCSDCGAKMTESEE